MGLMPAVPLHSHGLSSVWTISSMVTTAPHFNLAPLFIIYFARKPCFAIYSQNSEACSKLGRGRRRPEPRIPHTPEPVVPEPASGAEQQGRRPAQEDPRPLCQSPGRRMRTQAETHRGLTFSPLANTSKSSQCSFSWGLSKFSNFSSFPPLAN